MIQNGPHDTLRLRRLIPESVATGEPVLLQLHVDKKWLTCQQDLDKELDEVEFIRLLAEERIIGKRRPVQLNRLETFKDILKVEVRGLVLGQEASELGIPLPIDHVPPEFIYIDTLSELQPVIDHIAVSNRIIPNMQILPGVSRI